MSGFTQTLEVSPLSDGVNWVLLKSFSIYRGYYFGRDEVIHVQVSWQKLTRHGLDPETQVVSEKLGSGNYATISDPPQKLRAEPGYYISDLDTFTSDHTSGETFLRKIDIRQEKLPGIA